MCVALGWVAQQLSSTAQPSSSAAQLSSSAHQLSSAAQFSSSAQQLSSAAQPSTSTQQLSSATQLNRREREEREDSEVWISKSDIAKHLQTPSDFQKKIGDNWICLDMVGASYFKKLRDKALSKSPSETNFSLWGAKSLANLKNH